MKLINTFDKSSISEIDKVDVFDENLDDDYSFYMRKGGLKTKMKGNTFASNLTPDLNDSTKAVPFNSGAKRFFVPKNDSSITSIGPAYYNTNANNESAFIHKTHNKKGFGNSFISTTLRFENSKIKNLGPGPGQYFSETSSKRRNQLLKKSNVQYMFKQTESSNRYTKQKILPGPDYYDPKFDILNFKNDVTNCVFKSASARFPSVNFDQKDQQQKKNGLNFSSIPYKNYCNTIVNNNNQLELSQTQIQNSRIDEILKRRQIKNSSSFMQKLPLIYRPSMQDIKEKYKLSAEEEKLILCAFSPNQKNLENLKQSEPPQKIILKAHNQLSACFAPCKIDRSQGLISKDQLYNPGPGSYAYTQNLDYLRQKKELVSGSVFKSESAKFQTKGNNQTDNLNLGPGMYSTEKLSKKKQFHFNLKNLWL